MKLSEIRFVLGQKARKVENSVMGLCSTSNALVSQLINTSRTPVTKTTTIMEDIFTTHSDLFAMASHNHPFIVGCKDNTINNLQLNIWLLQDFKFMSHYVEFIKNLASISPDADKSFWESKAEVATNAMHTLMFTAITKRGLSLNGSVYPATTRLIKFLESLKARSYAIQVFAHLVFLKVYEDAWETLRYLIVNGKPAPGEPSLQDMELTLNPGFKQMLDHIESLALKGLESGECSMDEASLLFEEMMKLENDFWTMAMEEGRLEDFN